MGPQTPSMVSSTWGKNIIKQISFWYNQMGSQIRVGSILGEKILKYLMVLD